MYMIDRKSDIAPPEIKTPVTKVSSSGDSDKAPLWPFIWTLFWFKAITLSATYYFATRSNADISILVATHWFWMIIPLAAMAGPFVFQWRLRRVRRKRAALLASEWMLDA
jgi:hypothetical protein